MEDSAHNGSEMRDPVHQPHFVLNMPCTFMVKLLMTIRNKKTTKVMFLRDNNWMFDIVRNGCIRNSPSNSQAAQAWVTDASQTLFKNWSKNSLICGNAVTYM